DGFWEEVGGCRGDPERSGLGIHEEPLAVACVEIVAGALEPLDELLARLSLQLGVSFLRQVIFQGLQVFVRPLQAAGYPVAVEKPRALREDTRRPYDRAVLGEAGDVRDGIDEQAMADVRHL